jgi:hypothetical protein
MKKMASSNKKVLVTGSGGLIGSDCVRMLAKEGWQVVGVDNDMRRQFFGAAGTTQPVVRDLIANVPGYRHSGLDIRDRQAVRDIFEAERPDFIVHTAAQPSHDKAASIPYDDFDVNALGTMNVLVAARDFCPESPFCFTSTNKVYGDRPNFLPLVELEKRYDYAGGKRTAPSREAYAVLRVEPQQRSPLPAEVIQSRLVLPMINEAAFCLEDGIVPDPGKLDLAMIFGTGFPPFRGGLLRYADSLGLDRVFTRLDDLAERLGPRFAPSERIRELANSRCGFYPPSPPASTESLL